MRCAVTTHHAILESNPNFEAGPSWPYVGPGSSLSYLFLFICLTETRMFEEVVLSLNFCGMLDVDKSESRWVRVSEKDLRFPSFDVPRYVRCK